MLIKIDKAVVELQLVRFFIDGLYHDLLHMKVMTENPKTFQAAVQSAWTQQNLQKRFHLRYHAHDHPKTRTDKPMAIDHITPQRKCFLCHGGQFGKSRSDNAIAQVREPETDEVHYWR